MRHDRSYARILGIDARNAPLAVVYLAKQIQTVKGEIALMEKALCEYPAKIAERSKVLEALELALSLHPAGVDPGKLKPIRRNAPRVLEYGKLTKFIFQVLREKNGLAIPTFMVTTGVVRLAELELERKEFIQLNKQVLRHLNYMKKCHKVKREAAPSGAAKTDAYWRL